MINNINEDNIPNAPSRESVHKTEFTMSAHCLIELLLRKGVYDRVELPVKHELYKQIEEYVARGGLLYIQTKEFNGIPLKTPVVWHRGEWEIANDKWKTDKWQSERWRQLAHLELREVMKICVRLPDYFGQHALHIARTLWEKEDHAAARGLGITLEGVLFHDDLQKEVDVLMPELRKDQILLGGV